MKHAHYRSWLLGMALLSLLASREVFAISPSYIMFYGSQLAAPVVFQVDHTMGTAFLWETRSPHGRVLDRATIAKRLEGRTYLNFAVFWGQWHEKPDKPEQASQHGRLYIPTATEPAVVVATLPEMQAEDPNLKTPPARPVPVDLAQPRDAGGHLVGFVAGWALSAEELNTAKSLGIPGLIRYRAPKELR